MNYADTSKETCKKIYTTLGIMNQICPMLDKIERVELQLANRFMYDIALGRSDPTVHPWTPFTYTYFTEIDKTSMQKILVKLNATE